MLRTKRSRQSEQWSHKSSRFGGENIRRLHPFKSYSVGHPAPLTGSQGSQQGACLFNRHPARPAYSQSP